MSKIYHTEITVTPIAKNGGEKLGATAQCKMWTSDSPFKIDVSQFGKTSEIAKQNLINFMSSNGANEIQLVTTEEVEKVKFKEGQWIICQWEEDGDIDIARFEYYINDIHFMCSDYFRFYENGSYYDYSKEPEYSRVYDSRLKTQWRLATEEEIQKYAKKALNDR